MSEAGAALDSEVARWVSKGYAVEARTESQAILVRKRRIGLFWNVVLSVITSGIWLIVIAYRLINRKADRVVLTLVNGRVQRS
ncbi:hypothetical protein [Cellulomonas iranensis]|uniref:hypothetical protein n=1 Tax=Cellulomonas iranensis TaxID=76862 RepID=UPI0013D73222|nr:hypothetical protein [Cellulomonas iranensis]